MGVKTEIKDGLGSSRTASVTSQNALLVSVLPQSSRGIPPEDLSNLRQLREYFTNAGSELQNVDGSVTPVSFNVQATASVTKWVTGFKLVVESSQLDLTSNEFQRYGNAGGATGLTNGVDIEAFQSGVTTAITAQPVVSMGDYLSWCDSDKFVNIVGVAAGGADYVNFTFSFPQPIVLTEGSSDRLTIRINDNLSTLTTQFAIAEGYQEFS